MNFGASLNVWDRWMGTFYDTVSVAGDIHLTSAENEPSIPPAITAVQPA
jgi:hypothetical protein